jgi:hypothetical protein
MQNSAEQVKDFFKKNKLTFTALLNQPERSAPASACA